MSETTTQFSGVVTDYRHKEDSPAFFYTVQDKDNNVVDVSSYKKDTGCRKGDVVGFTYKVSADGKYKNLVGEMVKKLGVNNNVPDVVEEKVLSAPVGGVSPISREDLIVRQVCLKVASEVLSRCTKDLPTPQAIVMYCDDLFREFKK